MAFRTRVKICGIRDARMARVAVDAGADAIGVVLARGSPRQVSLEVARSLAREFADEVAVVAVIEGGSDWPRLRGEWPGPIQVHGDEAPDRFRAPGVCVIRGIRWSEEAVRRWDAEPGVAAILVDGPQGGSGRPFDHEALGPVRDHLSKPLIIAGGLTPGTVAAVVVRWRPYGVDVSSGVERAPGEKDPGAIRDFCQAARSVT